MVGDLVTAACLLRTCNTWIPWHSRSPDGCLGQARRRPTASQQPQQTALPDVTYRMQAHNCSAPTLRLSAPAPNAKWALARTGASLALALSTLLLGPGHPSSTRGSGRPTGHESVSVALPPGQSRGLERQSLGARGRLWNCNTDHAEQEQRERRNSAGLSCRAQTHVARLHRCNRYDRPPHPSRSSPTALHRLPRDLDMFCLLSRDFHLLSLTHPQP